MKYKYSAVSQLGSSARFVKKPLVQIELLWEDKSIKGLGLIDSGADKSLFNIEYAKVLGIDLTHSSLENFVGIGGKPIKCHIVEVNIRVQYIDQNVCMEVGFIESSSVDILLGQQDFFDQHRIKFEKDHDTFELTVVKGKKKRR